MPWGAFAGLREAEPTPIFDSVQREHADAVCAFESWECELLRHNTPEDKCDRMHSAVPVYTLVVF